MGRARRAVLPSRSGAGRGTGACLLRHRPRARHGAGPGQPSHRPPPAQQPSGRSLLGHRERRRHPVRRLAGHRTRARDTMDRALRRLASLMPALALLASGATSAAERLQTWHPWQLDSVAVAWVLSHTRHPAPEFESVQRGTVIAPGQAIDTPESTFRRTGQRTAFDEAVRLEKLDHPCVARLREAVRIVELAPWRRPEFPAVEAFEASVRRVMPAQPMRGGLERALAEVDRYCAQGP
ncbi:MAG: hypothetical protein EPO12_06400 [Aquabacterium sp.]|nr:MAG: hypothetical protein EPO12_06400 [Aquabacterium sp.]